MLQVDAPIEEVETPADASVVEISSDTLVPDRVKAFVVKVDALHLSS